MVVLTVSLYELFHSSGQLLCLRIVQSNSTLKRKIESQSAIMSDFPKGGDISSTRTWLDKEGFIGVFGGWKADAILGLDKTDIQTSIPGENGLKLWGFLNTARQTTGKTRHHMFTFIILHLVCCLFPVYCHLVFLHVVKLALISSLFWFCRCCLWWITSSVHQKRDVYLSKSRPCASSYLFRKH